METPCIVYKCMNEKSDFLLFTNLETETGHLILREHTYAKGDVGNLIKQI